MLTLIPRHQVARHLSQTRHDSVISPHPLRHPPERFASFSHGSSQVLNKNCLIQGMSNPHRGLPPSSSLSESVRLQQQQQPPIPQPHPAAHGYAPIQPQPAYTTTTRAEEESQYEGYYAAKIEEHKRYREEEKTRQQQIRLEQRKIEHDMLRECLSGGVPPHLIPGLFSALDGARMSGSSPVQQYHSAQPEYAAAGHPSRGSPPELRRETRAIPQQHPSYFAPPGSAIPHPTPLTQQPPPVFNPSNIYPTPVTHSPRGPRPGVFGHPAPGGSALRHPVSSSLPRLTTNEAQVQQPTATASSGYAAERASPSPSISFHHWQPPTISNAPRGETTKTSPRQPGPSGSESVATSSPRKRKDTRPHQAAPPPASHFVPRERSPMSERPASSHGRPPQHSRHSSAGQFRTRAYDPVRAQTQPRRATPDEFRRPATATTDQSSAHDAESGKLESSPR